MVDSRAGQALGGCQREPATLHGRFTHGLGLGDIDGDGRLDILWSRGWFAQPADLQQGGNWQHHAAKFAGTRGASQKFAYDVDGDGDRDVIAAYNAHGYGLNWVEQRPGDDEITFVKHEIMGSTPADNPHGVVFSNIHAMAMADIDGDGLEDLVAGNRYWLPSKSKPQPGQEVKDRGTPCLYWFRLTRREDGGVEFVPHRIESEAGVGTQVVSTDVTGDGRPDVVVGNKAGTFAYVHLHAHGSRTGSR